MHLSLSPGSVHTVTYRNWQGVTSERRIQVTEIYYGATTYHPTPQWLLRAWDLDKREERTFALADMRPAAQTPAGDGHA